MRARLRSWLVAFSLIAATQFSAPADACPFCDSDIGKQVRAEIFGPSFWGNVAIAMLPYSLLLGMVGIYHYGPAIRGDSPTHKTFNR